MFRTLPLRFANVGTPEVREFKSRFFESWITDRRLGDLVGGDFLGGGSVYQWRDIAWVIIFKASNFTVDAPANL